MRLALALILLFAGQTDPVSRSWNQPVAPFRIIGNVYYVGASDIASYLITTPKGHIVIDGGFQETAPMIRRNIEQLGFRVSDVRILLSSHAHYDHAGGLAELKSATGATFYASAEEAPQLARGGLGERDHSYDVVFLGSPSVPSGYRLVNNPRYPDAIADYRKQFAILRSLHCDVFLALHGNFFQLADKMKRRGGKTNPFIDRGGYRTFIERAAARMEQVVAEQQK
jgi:metallo-beta-lactamase class B